MIMPISTRGIGNVDISTASASKAKQKAEEKEMDAFASLMNMTANNDDNQVLDVEDVSKDYAKTNSVDDGKSDYNVKNDNKYAVKETATSKDTKADSDTVSNSEKTATKVTGNQMSQEDSVEDAARVLKAVEELIVEELNITPEELESILEDMNLDIEDLLIPANMRDFILQVNGNTNVDILINEDLASFVNDICAQVENILKEYNISDVSEFIELTDEFKNQIETYMSDMDNKTVVESTNTSDIPLVDEEVSEDAINVKVTREETPTNSGENIMKSDVNADTLTSDTNQSSSSQEFTGKDNDTNSIMNNLNQAINNVMTGEGPDGVTSYTDAVQEADIIRQIIDDIKVHLSKETTSIEVQLNPESLGKVQINVAAKDGIMQAQIIAETEAAKNAIENSLASLKEAFNNQELKVEAIEVMVATYEFFSNGQEEQYENQEQQTSTKLGRINLDKELGEETMSEEEQLQVEIMKAQGNRVSYTV